MKYMGRLGTKLVRNAAEDVGARKPGHRSKADSQPGPEEPDGFDSDGAPHAIRAQQRWLPSLGHGCG